MSKTTAAFLMLVASPVTLLWRGYVFSVLWAWFVVPVFGLAPLGFAAATGIFLIARYLNIHDNGAPTQDMDNYDRVARILTYEVAVPLSALIIGWLVHQFM